MEKYSKQRLSHEKFEEASPIHFAISESVSHPHRYPAGTNPKRYVGFPVPGKKAVQRVLHAL
jgi:hypothetical protein